MCYRRFPTNDAILCKTSHNCVALGESVSFEGEVKAVVNLCLVQVSLVNNSNVDVEVYSLDFDKQYLQEVCGVCAHVSHQCAQEEMLRSLDFVNGVLYTEPRLPGQPLPDSVLRAYRRKEKEKRKEKERQQQLAQAAQAQTQAQTGENKEGKDSKTEDAELTSAVGQLVTHVTSAPVTSLSPSDPSLSVSHTARNVLVLGAPFSGKTTTAHKLASQLAPSPLSPLSVVTLDGLVKNLYVTAWTIEREEERERQAEAERKAAAEKAAKAAEKGAKAKDKEKDKKKEKEKDKAADAKSDEKEKEKEASKDKPEEKEKPLEENTAKPKEKKEKGKDQEKKKEKEIKEQPTSPVLAPSAPVAPAQTAEEKAKEREISFEIRSLIDTHRRKAAEADAEAKEREKAEKKGKKTQAKEQTAAATDATAQAQTQPAAGTEEKKAETASTPAAVVKKSQKDKDKDNTTLDPALLDFSDCFCKLFALLVVSFCRFVFVVLSGIASASSCCRCVVRGCSCSCAPLHTHKTGV